MSETKQPWNQSMPEAQFNFMRDILAAPSPIGLEGAMTYGVLKPRFDKVKMEGWAVHQFRGNAGLVLDTHPGEDDRLTVMIIGHADKIRMQVRSISEDGKIWINSDSFLPLTLLGNEVILFSEDPEKPGNYREIRGGTIEALGAIHFADSSVRTGDKGLKPEQLYLELGLHGEDRKKQVEKLGIRAGDPILLDRPIRRGFGPDSFTGAYLDNGLGCFVSAECARILAEEGGLKNVRVLFAIATHEEIGRFGSRVLAGELKPDVVIGVDVNHDLEAAPGVGDKRFTPLKMGKGYTLSVGAVASEFLNRLFEEASIANEIPVQRDVCGRDTGTDAMAAVLASVDAAATSIGFPIRNMHTVSELGHTGDVLASIYAIVRTLQKMDEANDGKGLTAEDFRNGHPRLDQVETLTHRGA
ncbi:M20/M25/M40 family metallo-hydrolase [Bradymonadaceae bacterium TMQ3]|uniref:M20/M25/M40 family metallo-hydrolase n=1 Tax=Lujinxingia sediminis TaxID=2480984 RepID=A0ABY0CVA8_9DELT|nr:M20/M25/M40 family metallo-hydrolase [Lujinxingia sediminis]RDV37331.1 M20/M25/M40 family metallo-hydrolase [Bradymonadaceae bacterium TMQ3]RVU46720.1 M20/M25/M40 family metallo-hydrolase [Lujinxingia sediminis]TXC74731.1 M20/M25/M40 family metallo-hydrolase [Bradymonadales bacterium TMQ1]